MLEKVIRDSFKGITLVEEDVGFVNKLVSRQIAIAARASGLRVCFVTLAEEDRVSAQEKVQLGSAVGGSEEAIGLADLRSGVYPGSAEVVLAGLQYDLIVINSFTGYFVDKTERESIKLIREIEALSRNGKSFVIAYEPGILSEKATAYLKSVASNVVVIRTRLDGDRVDRMLYVPKLSSGEPLDRLIKITVDSAGVAEDTREMIG